MKIVFIGCVEIGLICLKQVVKDGWNVEAIFTLAKKYAKKTSGFADFSSLSKKNKITLYKVKDINTEANIARIKKIKPDLIIVCGWQRLIGEDILNIPAKGTIGFHSSLLPKYRGRAPVNWAIIMGEKKTGVTMFYCDPKADTGDIIAKRSFFITLRDTCRTIYDKSAKAASKLLHIYLPKIADGSVKRIYNRSGKARFWPKRRPEDGRINWKRKALDIHNWIRALTHPYPGAFTHYNGKRCFIWKSRYSDSSWSIKKSPGQILKIDKKGLLVATKNRPLWISEIRDENGSFMKNITEGGRFL